MDAKTTLRSRAPRSSGLLERYLAVRRATERLAEPLSPEDQLAQSMHEASPVKWHLAHTSWFFETFVLSPALPDYRPFHPDFGFLFNSYYDAVGERVARHRRGLLTRPALGEVRRYREHIDGGVRALLERGEALDGNAREALGENAPEALGENVRETLVLGLNHEEQHQELILTDVQHLFSLNPLRPAYAPPVHATSPRRAAPLRFLAREGGLCSIGHPGGGFAFDNEGPRHRVWLDAFEIASRPVTNGEFQGFIEDSGYRRSELWLSDGWDTVVRESWSAPLYWERDGERWRRFTLGGPADVDPAEPVVHVSYYEADAYARWAGARLPREEEWEHVAADVPLEGNFADSRALRPLAREDPRASSGANPGTGAPVALFGDVWEWTQSPYAPYPGYRPLEGALGEYNGKFMCNQFVLRGGSCASPRGHLRATYRNFFPPAARWQFSGLRLCR